MARASEAVIAINITLRFDPADMASKPLEHAEADVAQAARKALEDELIAGGFLESLRAIIAGHRADVEAGR